MTSDADLLVLAKPCHAGPVAWSRAPAWQRGGRPIDKLHLPLQAGFRDRMLVNNVLVTKGFDANWVSGRARSSHGTARIRGTVGALKFRGPSQRERSGSSSYSLGGERVYDAWGLVAGSSDSQQRYCANLGHRQDDETGTYTGGSPDGDGLVYMRARYYEPGTGRFISGDPKRSGSNRYGYCQNNPIDFGDRSGEIPEPLLQTWLADLETACFLNPLARGTLTAFCVLWSLDLATSEFPFISPGERGQMFRAVAEAWDIAETPGIVGTPGDQIRAETMAYSTCLLMSFWIIGEGGNLL